MQKLKQKLILITFAVFSMGVMNSMSPVLAAAADCKDSSPTGLQKCLTTNPIIKDLNIIVDFLSAGVGVVVVGTIILGGIQYSAAGDNPDGIKKAKQRIINGLTALLAFMLVFAFLQWIIPGGVFN